jgi:exonuclease SbcC
MIVEVEMINWRAYDQTSFKFKPGLNFIMGPNGKGKTSILEAISYALTGDVSVVDNPKDFLRDPKKPGTVKLTLAIKGKNYLIERTQMPDKAGDVFLYDIDENQRLATHHKNVTPKIEEIIGVSSDFLKRIIYMAEGDVFRFLRQPPKDALNQQVQRVLGLTQLDVFQDAIKAAKSNLRDRAKTLKLIQKRIQELLLGNLSLDETISDLDEKREIMLKQVLESQDAISRFDAQYQKVFELRQKIEGNLNFLKGSNQYWSNLEQKPLPDTLTQLNFE